MGIYVVVHRKILWLQLVFLTYFRLFPRDFFRKHRHTKFILNTILWWLSERLYNFCEDEPKCIYLEGVEFILPDYVYMFFIPFTFPLSFGKDIRDYDAFGIYIYIYCWYL